MKVLVVGGGGREHAIIRKLSESPKVEKIYCAPGNGGISCDAECVAINAMNKEKMVTFAKDNHIDFVVVTPDDPLADGMVDIMVRAKDAPQVNRGGRRSCVWSYCKGCYN